MCKIVLVPFSTVNNKKEEDKNKIKFLFTNYSETSLNQTLTKPNPD
jgi:hypothetical protein